jgi:hypothetical protein
VVDANGTFTDPPRSRPTREKLARKPNRGIFDRRLEHRVEAQHFANSRNDRRGCGVDRRVINAQHSDVAVAHEEDPFVPLQFGVVHDRLT